VSHNLVLLGLAHLVGRDAFFAGEAPNPKKKPKRNKASVRTQPSYCGNATNLAHATSRDIPDVVGSVTRVSIQ